MMGAECPYCGRWWSDPLASEAFPGSACDEGECLCSACEDGRCDKHHGERYEKLKERWRQALRGDR